MQRTVVTINSNGRQSASFIRVAAALGWQVRAQMRDLNGIVAREAVGAGQCHCLYRPAGRQEISRRPVQECAVRLHQYDPLGRRGCDWSLTSRCRKEGWHPTLHLLEHARPLRLWQQLESSAAVGPQVHCRAVCAPDWPAGHLCLLWHLPQQLHRPGFPAIPHGASARRRVSVAGTFPSRSSPAVARLGA